MALTCHLCSPTSPTASARQPTLLHTAAFTALTHTIFSLGRSSNTTAAPPTPLALACCCFTLFHTQVIFSRLSGHLLMPLIHLVQPGIQVAPAQRLPTLALLPLTLLHALLTLLGPPIIHHHLFSLFNGPYRLNTDDLLPLLVFDHQSGVWITRVIDKLNPSVTLSIQRFFIYTLYCVFSYTIFTERSQHQSAESLPLGQPASCKYSLLLSKPIPNADPVLLCPDSVHFRGHHSFLNSTVSQQ